MFKFNGSEKQNAWAQEIINAFIAEKGELFKAEKIAHHERIMETLTSAAELDAAAIIAERDSGLSVFGNHFRMSMRNERSENTIARSERDYKIYIECMVAKW